MIRTPIHTGSKDEDYGIEILVLGVLLLVKGHKISIAKFNEILDTMGKRLGKRFTCALRCADDETKSDGEGRCVENAEKSLYPVYGAILVNGHRRCGTRQPRMADAGRGCEKVWDDIKIKG